MKIFLLLIIMLAGLNTFSQDFPTYIRKNSVQVSSPDSLGKEVYNLLSGFKLIMVGEMHGTNEPVNLVGGLAELFTRFGDSVQVGFEIPNEQMKIFQKNRTDSSILQSHFFSKPSIDGRASNAWAATLQKLLHNKKVNIFFYDMDGEYSDLRDSMMYLNIKAEILSHPNRRTITISGNIHNMIMPFKTQNKTGYLLLHDKDLDLAGKFCSLNHQYESGTMMNNIGSGVERREVGPYVTSYGKFGTDGYLLLFPANMVDPYTGVYFTRKVTASEPVTSK